MRTAIALRLAHVPQRFGPATKLAQLFLNNKLIQKRSLSLKPEYEYNIDLVRHFISSNGDNAAIVQEPPYLSFNQQEIIRLRQSYISKHDIEADRKLIFIHAGSGGSAINLTLQQFAELARLIDKSNKVHFVLTAGPDELGAANKLSELLNSLDHSVYHSTEGLVNFSKFISICDLFISGSTGPLHIAGTLNVATAAFYPARQSATSLRWQTTNDENKRLAFMPDVYTGVNDMQTINIQECVDKINILLERFYQ
jgi:ADP-heptose:LPS heptosyltransferase